MTATSPKIRELFIEELADVQGGGLPPGDGGNTTMACCEEGPFGCCHSLPDPRDIIVIGP